MLRVSDLRRLTESVVPNDEARLRIKSRITRSIDSEALRITAQSVVPSASVRHSLKQRVLGALHGSSVHDDLHSLVDTVRVPTSFSHLRGAILARLSPEPAPQFVHSAVKWSAAFAVFLLLIRVMPLVFLPATQADIGVQLIPNDGDVEMFVNGAWLTVSEPDVLASSTLLRTGVASHATVILGNDGIVRLEPETSLRIQVASSSNPSVAGSSLTLVRGTLWLLGLRSTVGDSINIDTSHGTLLLNAGSASVKDDGTNVTVSMYDRGATLQYGSQTTLLVAGEKAVGYGSAPFVVHTMPASVFANAWVSENLSQDAVHRTEIAQIQQDRRARMAGALPGTILYFPKRIAEQVDVFFTLTKDGRNEKRVQQANTRLSEALALIKDGQNTEAEAPLTEYRDSLLLLASGTGDNLVKSLIRRQLVDASLSMTPNTLTNDATAALVRGVILDVSGAIPDAALEAKNIEGYALVDKLIEINRLLKTDHNVDEAIKAYADISPYLKTLLAENGSHPLLQKETKSLLASTSLLMKEEAQSTSNTQIAALQKDIAKYLPPEREGVEEFNARIDKKVEEILTLVFKNLISHTPRANELLRQMRDLTGPDRGAILRRLKSAVPNDSEVPNGFRGLVENEIQRLGDELNG